jgi:hypothetical protein
LWLSHCEQQIIRGKSFSDWMKREGERDFKEGSNIAINPG